MSPKRKRELTTTRPKTPRKKLKEGGLKKISTFDILKRLTDAHGVAGNESRAAAVALDLLKEYAPDAYIDKHGSVVGIIEGSKSGEDAETVLLDAHIDQVGLIVTYIDEKSGFVKAAPCGGADCRVLAAQSVTIQGEMPINGVICSKPPHVMKQADRNKPVKADEIWIDTGLAADEVKKSVLPGNTVTINGSLSALQGSIVSGAGLDNRAGVCAILHALRLLKNSNSGKKPRLCVSFSVQEELGCRGAAVTAYNADADYAIVVDVSFGMSPGVTDEKGNSIGKLGKGPMIGYAPSLNREMFDGLNKTAQSRNIPCQLEIMSRDTSGTNADPIGIVKGGVKTALVSIPLRYMHTPVETVDLRDIESVGKLIAEYLQLL